MPPGSAIDLFSRDTRDCPKFTKAEEKVLAARMHSGDLEARDLLFRSCVPYAIFLADRAVRKAGIEDPAAVQDITQEAVVGLFLCLEDFHPEEFDTKLVTFANQRIRRAIQWWLYRQDLIRIPEGTLRKGRPDTPSGRGVDRLYSRTSSKSRACWRDDRAAIDHGLDNKLTWLPKLRKLLNKKLKARERFVLLDRLDGKTLVTIAQSLGISPERVRQIEESALEKLKLTRQHFKGLR